MKKIKKFLKDVYNESCVNDLEKNISSKNIVYKTEHPIYKELRIGDTFLMENQILNMQEYNYYRRHNMPIGVIEKIEFFGFNNFSEFKFIFLRNGGDSVIYVSRDLRCYITHYISFIEHNIRIKQKVTSLKQKIDLL